MKEEKKPHGRPQIGRAINIKIPDEMLDEIGRIADKLNIDKAHVHRSLILMGLDVFHFYEKLGVVKLIEIANRNEERLRVYEEIGRVPA